MNDERSPELRRFLLRAKFRALMGGLLNRHPAPPPSRAERPEDRRRATSTPDLIEPDVVDMISGSVPE